MAEEPQQKFNECIITLRVLTRGNTEHLSDPDKLAGILMMLANRKRSGDTVEVLGVHHREISDVHAAEMLSALDLDPAEYDLENLVELARGMYDSASVDGCDSDLIVVGREQYNALMDLACLRAFKAPVKDESDE